MADYYEVKPNTEEYDMAKKLFTYHKDWGKVSEELSWVVGIDINKNLKINPHNLLLKHIPEGTRNQFKKYKKEGCYEAFKKSDMNKAFLEVVQKHGLKIYTFFDFARFFGFSYIHILSQINLNGDNFRFFIELNTGLSDESIQKFNQHAALTKFKESELLELRAQQARAEENLQAAG